MKRQGEPGGASEAIWVASDLSADQNGYVLAVHFNRDSTHVLNPDEAVVYASAVFEASAIAAYEAALFAQLTRKVGLPTAAAAELLATLRSTRDHQTWSAGPMALTPGVSVFTGQPFLHCRVGQQKWQWTPADAEQHAHHVMASIPVVKLDTAYLRYLLKEQQSELALATAVVQDIDNFRSGGM